MLQEQIFIPFFGMMLLTLIVWSYMYIIRIRYSISNKIKAQDVPTPEKLSALLPDEINNASNNFKNLFEMPVLFYALCLYLFEIEAVDVFYLTCAYLFLIFRCLHSFIQSTSNTVLTRFKVYMFSSLVLWVMLLCAVVEAII